jgi:hypothetical protein
MFITKLRLSNVKFPIETVRWRNIPIANRLYSKCTTGMIGDEFLENNKNNYNQLHIKQVG